MATTTFTLKSLEDERALFDSTIAALHLRFKDDIKYHEVRPDGSMRRPLFVIKSQSDLDYLKSVIHSLSKIKENISAMMGKRCIAPIPMLEEQVLLYRNWENIDRSSTGALCSRIEIINRIKKRIAMLERYDDHTSALLCEQLRKELHFFENDPEEHYRARSKGTLTSVVGLTCNNSIDKRVRINEAGLFLVGPMFEEPKGAFPTKDKERKERPSIYSAIAPVPYCGAMNTELRRESEIIARKKAMGWDDNKQADVKEARRNKTTRRHKTASLNAASPEIASD